MSGFFYNLGRHLGHNAVPAFRKSKNIWDTVAGSEEEAFRAEMRLGADMAAEVRATVQITKEAETQRVLVEACRCLSAHLRDKRRTFLCEVFHDSCPNAMALPGGYLFLSDQLLEFCERRQGELAFVIGHEMAHVALGHAWDRMFNEAVLQAAALATARVGQIGAWLHQQGFALLRKAHSREQELQADELGFRLACAAGYAVSGPADLLGRISRLKPAQLALCQYLASHPPASERLASLQRIQTRASNTQDS